MKRKSPFVDGEHRHPPRPAPCWSYGARFDAHAATNSACSASAGSVANCDARYPLETHTTTIGRRRSGPSSPPGASKSTRHALRARRMPAPCARMRRYGWGRGPRSQDRRDRGLQVDAPTTEPIDLRASLGREDHLPRQDGVRRVEPARPRLGVRVGVRDVRLEIEDGGAVEQVHAAHVNGPPTDPVDGHGAQADRVWAVRRTRGEDPSLAIAPRRQDLRLPAPPLLHVPVKDEDDPRVRPRREPVERVLEAAAREELDRGGDVRGERGLPGCGAPLGERRTNDANRLEEVRRHRCVKDGPARAIGP